MKQYLFSFNAETNELYGEAFSIATVVVDVMTGQEIDRCIYRCPLKNPVPWVQKNVLPNMEDIQITNHDYSAMLTDFIMFYKKYKEFSDILVHMGVPVEARLFIDAYKMDILDVMRGPYPLIDISAYAEIRTSVNSYNQKHNLTVPALSGDTHNPLYDSIAALIAYQHYNKLSISYQGD